MTKSSAKAKHGSAGTSTKPVPRAQRMVVGQTPMDQRQHMIAEAAYYLAEHRGFQGGDPVQDWLRAEAEIDHRLMGSPSH